MYLSYWIAVPPRALWEVLVKAIQKLFVLAVSNLTLLELVTILLREV